jgi:hypothetical protein
LPGEDIVTATVFDDRSAIDDHGFHARRMAPYFLGDPRVGKLFAHEIVDFVGIEDLSRPLASLPSKPPIEAKFFCRIAGNFMHRLLEAEKVFLARPIAENFRRGAMPEENGRGARPHRCR